GAVLAQTCRSRGRLSGSLSVAGAGHQQAGGYGYGREQCLHDLSPGGVVGHRRIVGRAGPRRWVTRAQRIQLTWSNYCVNAGTKALPVTNAIPVEGLCLASRASTDQEHQRRSRQAVEPEQMPAVLLQPARQPA